MTIENRVSKLKFKILIPLVSISVKQIGIKSTIELFCDPKRFKKVQSADNVNNARLVLSALKQTVQDARFNGNCLSRSIALHRLLQGKGISSNIKIGVSTRKNKFRAHAWVEHQGIPLNAGAKVRNRYQTLEGYEMIDTMEFS